MRRRKQQRIKKSRPVRSAQSQSSDSSPRRLQFQTLESRQLLAGDVGDAFADITGLWVTVGDREYFTSEEANVSVDMYAGETLQITGVRYGLSESYTPNDGVIAFESYVRREHGASSIGSYDYTDGRFADPVEDEQIAGQVYEHGGNDSGWELDVIDNRIAVVAIRYFGDESAVEDRMFIDVNVVNPPDTSAWTETVASVKGDWQSDEEGLGGDSRGGDGKTGLTVIETGNTLSDRYEVGVKAKTVEENTWANGFVVVDYHNENDFIYAGLRSIADQWVIGHFDGNFNDLAELDQEVNARQVYDLRVAVDGSNVALAVDGILRVSHDFERSLGGAVGLANQYAFTHFSDFHYFDNSHTLAPTPQEVYDEAVIDAQEADQARQDAVAAADAATQLSLQAEANAQALESHSAQLRSAADNAAVAHRQATDAVEQAEQTIEQSSAAIHTAEKDRRAAESAIEDLDENLEDAIENLEESNEDSQEARESLEEISEEIQSLQQDVDEAVAASEDASATAATLRAVSDEAARLADEAKGGPKAIRKLAKEAAKAADKIADEAESEAKDAAKDAENAVKELRKANDDLSDAQQEADRAEQKSAEAQNAVNETRAALDNATRAIDSATQAIRDGEAARAAAEEQLPELRQRAGELAEESAHARNDSDAANQEAEGAREAANRAAEEAANVREEAEQSAEAAESAQQSLAAAELALQEAIAAEQAALENEDFRAYSLNFNHQDDGAFETVAGQADRVAGQLHLTSAKGELAISVLDDSALPERTATRMYTTVRADNVKDLYQNGFIVFDYQSPEDFKYAGAWAGADRWAIGEVVDGELVDVETLDEVIGQGPAYELQVWIEEDTVTFLVEGVQKLQHTFDEAIDDGQLGIANTGARSRFDQVAVMQLYGGAGDAGLDQGDPAANDSAINELF